MIVHIFKTFFVYFNYLRCNINNSSEPNTGLLKKFNNDKNNQGMLGYGKVCYVISNYVISSYVMVRYVMLYPVMLC